jgi:hypothetical protein
MRKLNRRQTNFILTEVMGIILALAVAFFFVAMPSDVFERLVSASGLPQVIPAAQPPLSDVTRMIVGALGGSLAGMAVILFFLLIEREPEQKPESVRPFFANEELELAEPMPVMTAKPLDFTPIRAEAITVPFEVVETSVVSAVEEPKDEPIFLDFRAIRAANQRAEEAPLDLSQWTVAEPEAAPAAKQATMPSPASVITPEVTLRPISSPDRRVEEESIAALMKRLETGLDRRMESGSAPTKRPDINRSSAGLSSTLEELRKMAVRR